MFRFPPQRYLEKTLIKTKSEARSELKEVYIYLYICMYVEYSSMFDFYLGCISLTYWTILCFSVVLLISPQEDRRRFMIAAHDLGMTSGDYVFYTIDMLPDNEVMTSVILSTQVDNY